MKLTGSLKSRLYWFIEDYSKGLLGDDRWDLTNDSFEEGLLDWATYREAIVDPGVMKEAITVWSNTIEVDASGEVTNAEWARFRAFQLIRHHFDRNFKSEHIIPPYEVWEYMENQCGDE